MSFDINTVDEIYVKFTTESGNKDIVYRGKGLEKFRRLICSSPAYGEQGPLIIDEDSSDEVKVPIKKKSSKKKKDKPTPAAAASNGYAQHNLNYAPTDVNPSRGRSAVDLAREMEQQAASMGFQFK